MRPFQGCVKTIRTLKALVVASLASATIGSAPALGGQGEGVYLQAGLFYYSEKVDVKSSSSEQSRGTSTTTNLNITGGYQFGNALSLGLKYYDETSDAHTGWFSNSSATPNSETTAIGPMVGFLFGKLLAQGCYMALQAPEKSTGSFKYSGGSGYIVDAMYLFDLGGWSFGPQFSLIHFEYKKTFTNGIETDSEFATTEEYVVPYFSFYVHL
jgi:hypothetical protein